MGGIVELGDDRHSACLGVGLQRHEVLPGPRRLRGQELRKRLGRPGTDLVVGQVQLQVVHLVEPAHVHHVAERLRAVGIPPHVDQEAPERAVRSVVDLHGRPRDAGVVESGEQEEAGRGLRGAGTVLRRHVNSGGADAESIGQPAGQRLVLEHHGRSSGGSRSSCHGYFLGPEFSQPVREGLRLRAKALVPDHDLVREPSLAGALHSVACRRHQLLSFRDHARERSDGEHSGHSQPPQYFHGRRIRDPFHGRVPISAVDHRPNRALPRGSGRSIVQMPRPYVHATSWREVRWISRS